MSVLADKLRRALEGDVKVGDYTFRFRRPTWTEAQRIAGDNAAERLLSHVIGWSGVRESDIIPNGDPHPAQFDSDVCLMWLSDRPDLATAISRAIMDSYSAYVDRLGETLKN